MRLVRGQEANICADCVVLVTDLLKAQQDNGATPGWQVGWLESPQQ